MTHPRIVALVPTISLSRLAAAAPWISALHDNGVDVRVVANAASVAAVAAPRGAQIIDTRANPGFARSITAALRTIEAWDWVLLLNDDLLFDASTPARLRAAIDSAAPADGILFFDPEPPRPIPGRRGVFASLSLIDSVAARVHRRGTDASAPPSSSAPTYKSFSAVALSHDAWCAVGGLDDRFAFCFEDAFLVRAHLAHGGIPPTTVDVGISHDKSATTGRHVARVLPVIASSAHTYLRLTGSSDRVADAVVLAALLVRVPFLPFASAAPGAHLRGVLAAMHAVARHREPALPEYELL